MPYSAKEEWLRRKKEKEDAIAAKLKAEEDARIKFEEEKLQAATLEKEKEEKRQREIERKRKVEEETRQRREDLLNGVTPDSRLLLTSMFSYLLPQDLSTRRRHERSVLSPLLLVSQTWRTLSKANYYQRCHTFEMFEDSQGVNPQTMCDYCMGDFSIDVNLSNARELTDAVMVRIIQKCLFVTSWTLNRCRNLTAASLDMIAVKSRRLNRLSLAACSSISERSLGTFMKKCGRNLSFLNMSDCPFVDSRLLQNVCQFCPNLTTLEVMNCNLDDFACHHIASYSPKNIAILKIGGNTKITDQGIVTLLDSIGSHLTELDMEGLEQAGSTAMLSVSQRCAESLKVLKISNCCGLDDASLHVLSQCLKHLELLDIGHCPNVSRSSIKELVFHADIVEPPHILM